jgi:hypothetical protein
MTTTALCGSSRPSLLLKPQMAPFTLAMKGILGVHAACLWPQAVAGLALLHRLPFVPDIAPPPIVVMALGAAYPPGFMELVAELHRRFTASRARNFKETHQWWLGESGMGSQKGQHSEDQPRHVGHTTSGQPHTSVLIIGGAGGIGFPDVDPSDGNPVAIEDGPQALIEVAGQIFRRRVAVLKSGQFI